MEHSKFSDFIGRYQAMLIFYTTVNHVQRLWKQSSEVSVARCNRWNSECSIIGMQIQNISKYDPMIGLRFHLVWNLQLYSLNLPEGFLYKHSVFI